MICVAYSKKTANNRLREQVGIKEQNDRIRDYASRIGLKISKFYEDKSDDPLSDNGYQQLRLDGMNRKFDLVLLESVNRFGAGNGMARSLLVDTFSIIGIDFIVTQDGFDSREHNLDEIEAYFKDTRRAYANSWRASAGKEKKRRSRRKRVVDTVNAPEEKAVPQEPVPCWEEIEAEYKKRAKALFEMSVEIQKDNLPLYIKMENGEITEQEYLAYHDRMIEELKPVNDQFEALVTDLNKQRSLYKKKYVNAVSKKSAES